MKGGEDDRAGAKRRTAWKARVVVYGSLALFVAGYLFCQPNHRFATPAELRAVSPPELLVALPQDKAAQDRFRQLRTLCEDMKEADALGMPFEASEIQDSKALAACRQKLMGANQKLIESAVALLAQGPVQEPIDDTNWRFDTSYFHLSRILAYEAELAGRLGDQKECEEDVLESLRLSKAMTNATRTQISVLSRWLVDSFAEGSAVDCAR